MQIDWDSYFEKLAQDKVEFAETMALIGQHYDYTPTHFSNGLGDEILHNPPGENEGSCKVFAFGLLNHLNEQQTLRCFGRFYRDEVLQSPHTENHPNIRRFIKYGWSGIQFDEPALKPKL